MGYVSWAFLASILILSTFGAAFGEEALRREVYFNGTPDDTWDSRRDTERLNQEYTHHSFTEHNGALRWRFVSQEQPYADLFLRRPIDRPFHSMIVRIRNAGTAFNFSIKVVDTGGADYSVPPVRLAGKSDWREVRFTWEQFEVASWSADPDGHFNWPATEFAVIAFGVEKGKEYDIHISEIALLYDLPDQVHAVGSHIPQSAEAGDELEIGVTLTPKDDITIDGKAELQLVRDETIASRAPLPLPSPTSTWKAGETISAGPVALPIPLFVFGGEYQVRLVMGEKNIKVITAADKKGNLGTVQVNARQPGHTVAEVRGHNGVPTLVLNEKPDSSMFYMSYSPGGKRYRQFGEAGVKLYSFSSTPTESGYGLSREAWVAPDQFDYSHANQRVMLVLENNPDAYFVPRLNLRAPKWWTDAHPNEIVTHDPGDGKPVPFLHEGSRHVPSWASEIWREDTAEALRRYIRHMEESPWADRVIGYHLASGTTEEWMQWGGNENMWVDYSQPNLEAFRRWLTAKYETQEAFQEAWNDPELTFETAAIPTKAQREASAVFTLLDPEKEQAVIDYTLYTSDLTAETICYFSQVVKEATNREKIVGTFYGYVLQLAGEHRQQNAGHLAMDKVLSCPHIDFITSPSSYAFREPGTGYSHFMSLTDSIKLHGKLWINENDIRTWLSPPPRGWGWTETYEESLLMQKREFANTLANGCGKWWFDMTGGWFDDPRMMSEIAKMRALADESVDWDRRPVSEIAFILDPRSLAWMKTGNYLSHPMLMMQLSQLGRMGAPFGYYMLDDLAHLPPHKMYIFVSCLAPTETQRELIDRVVKRKGQVAVWIYGQGLYRNGQIDEEGMHAMTGIHLKLAREEAPFAVGVTGDDPLLTGLRDDLQYGTENTVGPVIYADDPEAKVLGRLIDSDRAGLVVRRYPEWTSVYSAAPILPAKLLRNLARSAGVHLYIEGDDVVYANRSLLAISVNEGGPRTIRLPRTATVIELYSGEIIGEEITEFIADIPDKGTALYHLE